MKTLFLNPNSSEEITTTLRRHIARGGWPAERWAVAKVDAAPRIIGSASDDALASAALVRALPTLSRGFDRVVTMSSVDTGYEGARERFGPAAFGFTRSVLARRHQLGHRLQVVTFDRSMTALYEAAFEKTGHGAIVDGWSVVDRTPAEVAARPQAALKEVRARCESAGGRGSVFIVGAVGLELARSLREDGLDHVIDPVTDLLTWLGPGTL